MAHGSTKKRVRTESINNDINDELPPPPDGGWGWMVVFGSFAIHIVTDGITYSFGVFYAEFLNYFGEGKGYTAWIVSLLVGVTLCSGPISSSFVNRYGCRNVTIAGSLLASICLIFSVFAKNILTLIFTVGIGTGFGFGLIYLPAIVSVTMYFEKYRSLATGIAVCGSGLGTFIFAPLTESLISNYGWRGTTLIISAIVLNCMIFGALFRPLKMPKVKVLVPISNSNSEEGKLLKENKFQTNNNNENLLRSQSTHEIKRTETPISTIVIDEYATKTNGMRLTSSQPLLASPTQEKPNKESHLSSSGTMYRPDILYQGSLVNISQFRSRGELSNSNTDRYGSLRKDTIRNFEDLDNKACGCVPCSKETRDTFSEMMNFSLFKDPVFIIFTVSNFLTSIGFSIPYVYLVPQAEKLDISKIDASYLLSVIGIANTVGRVVLGFISDKPWVNRLWVYNVCLTVCGLATALSIFCVSFISLAIYSTVYGFTIGAYVGLTSVILVDLLGLDKLTNAFGLLLLFQGIASLIGPPLAGLLFDVLDSYKPGFLLGGITIAISGIILFLIPPLQRHIIRKNNRNCPNHGQMMVPL